MLDLFTTTFAFFPGGMEIWVILIVALLLFGTRIPSVMRSLGAGVTEFKKGVQEGDSATLDEPSEERSAEASVKESSVAS